MTAYFFINLLKFFESRMGSSTGSPKSCGFSFALRTMYSDDMLFSFQALI